MNASMLIELNFENLSLPSTFTVPGSKYHANRALILAHYSGGKTLLQNIPDNDDLSAALNLKSFNAHDSGTLWRFLVGVAATQSRPIAVEASEQLLKRPLGPLLQAIVQLGASYTLDDRGVPTITGPMRGGKVEVQASVSSQFVSSLLMAAPLMAEGLELNLQGKLASPLYVTMTIDLMKQFGVEVEAFEDGWRVRPGQRYQAIDYMIPGDWSYASVMMVAACLLKQKIVFHPLVKGEAQGETAIIEVLQQMGGKVSIDEIKQMVEVDGTDMEFIHPVTVDMQNLPDSLPALTILAAFSEGVSIFQNVSNLRFKESNRLQVLQRELRKVGVVVKFDESFLTMTIQGVGRNYRMQDDLEFDPESDHRMAFCLSLLGMKNGSKKFRLKNAECVNKSNPHFWFQLQQMGVISQLLEPGQQHLYLIGYRASGKTTLAKILGQILLPKQKVVHMDEELTRIFQMSIHDFVTLHGWKAFRDEEERLLRKLSMSEIPLIIDCGGGVIEREQNIFWMKKTGRVVYLQVSKKTREQRLKSDSTNTSLHRPGGLMNLDEREIIYQKCADLIVQND